MKTDGEHAAETATATIKLIYRWACQVFPGDPLPLIRTLGPMQKDIVVAGQLRMTLCDFFLFFVFYSDSPQTC